MEYRGFEYHTGIGFTIFAPRVRGELGSGGRYLAMAGDGGPDEPATGATLYLETILRAIPGPANGDRIFLPFGTPPQAARALRQDGWTTLAALDPDVDPKVEAERLGCTHVLGDGKPVALTGPDTKTKPSKKDK